MAGGPSAAGPDLGAYVALARPRGLLWVVAVPWLGFGFAHWDYALPLRSGPAMAMVTLAWLALHCGTLWLNAALDRDGAPVLFGAPTRVPAGIVPAALVALVLSVTLALFAGPVAGACATACAGMAVAYSHPVWRLKGHPLAGPAINLVGYGVLSPIAGFSLVSVPPTPRGAFTLAVVAGSAAGAYFAAQAFQATEDRQRGYRTLVVTHGPAAAITAARVAFGLAFSVAMGLSIAGWYPRACVLAAPVMIAVDARLRRWAARPGGGDESDARATVRWLVAVGVALVAGASAEYVRASLAGQPVAGLGTVAGAPRPTGTR